MMTAERLAGRYELVSLLGEGGMGRVYLARDSELDEIVALKTLSSDVANMSDAMDRFRREVKLARKVTHVNVARTYDIGEHDGLRFLTMEYIEGESLGDRIARSGALPFDLVMRVVRDAGAGLVAAHAAGVIHRDLKPDNVILAKDGRIVITDFGIARAYTDGNRDLTGGRPIGTPSYMAPEQVEGREADHRADIYALGELCFEALTGIPPFRGETIYAVAAARLIQPPPDPCALRRGAPAELGLAVTKAMAKDPAARFASVKDFLDALSGVSFPAEESSRNLAALAATMPMAPITLERTIASSASSSGGTHRKSVAVLPFKNAGPPEGAYLASGLAEAITDSLSMDERLRVISHAKVTAMYAEGDDPRDLGEKLGVQVVCAGTIARAGDTLRVTARLVAVEDSVQMWAKRLEAKAADFFQLTDDAAEAILGGLALEKREEADRREIPADPAILDLYLRARYASRTNNPEAAVAILNDAMTRAPDEPALLSLYAAVQTARFNRELDPGIADEAGALAKQAAERAIAIAPKASIPRMAMGELLIAHGDVERGARELAAALRIDDRLADAAASLGQLRVRVGDTKGGMRLLKRAISLDPSLLPATSELILLSELTGDTEFVDQFLSRPPPESPHELWAYWYVRARILLWRNDVARAEHDLTVTDRGPMAPATHILHGIVTHTVTEQNIMELTRRMRVGARSIARTQYFAKIMTEVYTVVGNLEGAMQSLRDADKALLHDALWIDACPTIAPLRANPELAGIADRTRERARKVLAAI